MRGAAVDTALPLDIRATAFQRRVWTYLQSIPFGKTRSYSQVAKAIGAPAGLPCRGPRLCHQPSSRRHPMPSRGP